MKIEIKDVEKRFGSTKVLEGVNVEFIPNKIYGIVGENSSGKSVLLKMICGLYEPTNGDILFNGINILEDNKLLLDTRIVLDNFGFIEDMSGLDNLIMLANIQKKINNEEIYKTLEDVCLLDEKDKLYRNYSSGNKKKLCIAQAIMEKSSVIILDDLFIGLDEMTRKKISDKLLEIKKNGRIIIISSQSIDDIKHIADVIYMIDNNKLIKIKTNKK